MQLEVVIYISISYLATHRRVSRHKAQAKISIKKGTGDKIQAKRTVLIKFHEQVAMDMESGKFNLRLSCNIW